MSITRLPEPALVRSILVAITGVAAFILGRSVSVEWVETITNFYALLTPVVAGLVIRPAVTPVDRPALDLPEE